MDQPCKVGMLDEQLREQCYECLDEYGMNCECDFNHTVASQARFWLDETSVVKCVVEEHIQIDDQQVSKPQSLQYFCLQDKNPTRLAVRVPGQHYTHTVQLVGDSHQCWFVLDSTDSQESLDSLTDKAFAALDAIAGLGLAAKLAVLANSFSSQAKKAKRAKPGSRKATSLADSMRSQLVLQLAKLKHACQTMIMSKLTSSAKRMVQLGQLSAFDSKLAQSISTGLAGLLVDFAVYKQPMLHQILAEQKECCHVSKK